MSEERLVSSTVLTYILTLDSRRMKFDYLIILPNFVDDNFNFFSCEIIYYERTVADQPKGGYSSVIDVYCKVRNRRSV